MVIAATVVPFLAMPPAQAAAVGGEVLELPKAAPYFRSLDTEVIEVGRATHEVDGTDVQVRELQIDQEVSFFEATWHLADVLDLLLDYEEVEALVALIGDWYTADLYRVIIDELYVDECKTAVRAKLDELRPSRTRPA